MLINFIDLDLSKRKIDLPNFKTNKDISSKEYLNNLSLKGLNKRLKDYTGDKLDYYQRLDYELEVIDKMGFNDYFLIVWDFIRYAKTNGIMVGPGRGSAAGSLVAYSIGITNINPLKYDLLFERFLNPERVTMPDIDTDFSDERRLDVINYVKDLYKDTHVCSIITFDRFKIRSAVRELSRIRKMDNKRIDELVKIASEAYNNNTYDELIVNSNSEIKEILELALCLIDLPRNVSTHTAGIILSNDNLFDIIPLKNGNNIYMSQLEAIDLEELGLLKIDFLGLKELSILNNTLNSIDSLNLFNIYDIPLNDKLTFDLLSRGDTYGIFQLDGEGITKVIKKLKPSCFNDLVALLALYRPGPMDYIDEFIDRKNGKPFEYVSPDLEDILGETYGIIIYQEQIMRICLKFAGYSLGEADILRRAVSKKKEDVLISERKRFVLSSMKLGYSSDISNSIYDDIVKFANYGFNKSHSVAYAMLTYVMSYLKANYPKEYILAMLNNSIGNFNTTNYYINYARKLGIKILNPNIFISSNKYVLYDGNILMPLNQIKTINSKVALNIYSENRKEKFISFMDFKNRMELSDDNLKALIYSCALDDFNLSKKYLINTILGIGDVINNYLNDKIDIDNSEYDLEELKMKELETIGFNIKYNIFKDIDILKQKYHTTSIDINKLNGRYKIIAKFDEIKEIMTKKNELMLVGSINDSVTSLNYIMFSSDYSKVRGSLLKSRLYIIEGQIDKDKLNNSPLFIIKYLKEI